MTQGVLKTHGICLMYFINNWNAGPFFYFMDILEEKNHIYIYIYIYIKEIIKKRTKRIFHNILVVKML